MHDDKLYHASTVNPFLSTAIRAWPETSCDAGPKNDFRESFRKVQHPSYSKEKRDPGFDLSFSRSKQKKGLQKRFWTVEEVVQTELG